MSKKGYSSKAKSRVEKWTLFELKTLKDNIKFMKSGSTNRSVKDIIIQRRWLSWVDALGTGLHSCLCLFSLCSFILTDDLIAVWPCCSFFSLPLQMKVWAKVHDINSSKDHTLNSLSIILLVAFHLQVLFILYI